MSNGLCLLLFVPFHDIPQETNIYIYIYATSGWLIRIGYIIEYISSYPSQRILQMA